MTIPLSSTTVALLAPGSISTGDDSDDWGGAPDPETGYSVVASGIRAHFSAPSASASFAGEGSSVTAQFRLLADPCDLRNNYLVEDETTGLRYSVDWVLPRPAILAHVVAGVSRSTGTA